MIFTKKQFQSQTSVFGRRKNPLILKVDALLDSYHNSGAHNTSAAEATLLALLTAVNTWLEAKSEKIHKGASGRRSGVIQLKAQVEAGLHKLKPITRKERKITLPGMCAKRTRFDNVNTDRKASPIREMDIYQGATRHLTIREAIWPSALTSGPWSERRKGTIAIQQIDAAEGPRKNMPDSHPFAATAIDVASRAIIQARKMLPLGAFNNRHVQSRPPSWTQHPAWQNALNEAVASGLVLETGNRDPEDYVAWLAAFATATRTTGGGVCTYFASLTCGILTTIAPPGSDILLVYSRADHQFCVLSVNGSPWYTVDPWTLNSYVLRWERSYFGPGSQPKGGIDNYFKIRVHEPIHTPYGISYTSTDIRSHLARASKSLGPQKTDDMAHNFGHCCNAPRLELCGRSGKYPIDGRLPVQTYKDWG